MIFRITKPISREEYDRWKAYIESKNPAAIVLPEYIDVYDEGYEEVEENGEQ